MKELDYPFNSADIRRQAKKFKKQLLDQENLLSKRVAILSGSTVGQMKVMLELFLLNQGIHPVLYEGQYNNFYEESVFDITEWQGQGSCANGISACDSEKVHQPIRR